MRGLRSLKAHSSSLAPTSSDWLKSGVAKAKVERTQERFDIKSKLPAVDTAIVQAQISTDPSPTRTFSRIFRCSGYPRSADRRHLQQIRQNGYIATVLMNVLVRARRPRGRTLMPGSTRKDALG